MLINNSVGSLSSLYQTPSMTSSRSARSQVARSFKDEMMLSAEAQSFKDMLKKLRQSSGDVRLDKVDEYSARIADDDYYISSDDIAASMLGVH